MFGNSKSAFDTPPSGTDSEALNHSSTGSPFGQSDGGRPSIFGGQRTAATLFGATANSLGAASTSSAFGAPTAAESASGGLSQPQQNKSIFGAAELATNETSVTGEQTTSVFGSVELGGFAQTAPQETKSLFGKTPVPVSTSASSTIGDANTVANNTSESGQLVATDGNAGTSLAKFKPTITEDAVMENTKLQSITAMQEYETKSLAELRLEDYKANRKPGTSGSSDAITQSNTGTGLFGATTQQTLGLFGQLTDATDKKPQFCTSAFGQKSTTAFGTNTLEQHNFLAKPFGQTATTAFGAPAQDAASNPFGQKPAFGQPAAPSLFGQNRATSTANAFGQPGFSGFSATAGQQQPSMFGNTTTDANKPPLGWGGTSIANAGFGGFGNTVTGVARGGLFGQKPNTDLGSNTHKFTFGFGIPDQTKLEKSVKCAFDPKASFGNQQITPSIFGESTGQTMRKGRHERLTAVRRFNKKSNCGVAESFGQQTSSAIGTAAKLGGLGGFGQTAPQQNTSALGNVASRPKVGTHISKYQPTPGIDTVIQRGEPKDIKTKLHCITALKEYETKSLEELRLEDFEASRKDGQENTSSTDGFLGAPAPLTTAAWLFGTTALQTKGLFIFGQPAGATENKPLFGTSAFGQANTSTFALNEQQKNNSVTRLFRQSATTSFGAKTQNATASSFESKPLFGQSTPPMLFGCTPTGCRTDGRLNFGGFGGTAIQQQPSMFTTNGKPTFGFFGTSTALPFGQSSLGETGQTSNSGAQQTGQPLSRFGKMNTSTKPSFCGFLPSVQPTSNTTWMFGPHSSTPDGPLGFGRTTPQQTSFGPFGQTNTATANFGSNTSVFGQATAAGCSVGTSVAKYQVTVITESLMQGGSPKNVTANYHCITAMKEYEGKSLEELRHEDYTTKNPNLQASASTTSGLVGITLQPTASFQTGLFGTTPQQAMGLFGQPAGAAGRTSLGQTSTSAFGANIQQQNNFLTHFEQTAATGVAAQGQNAAASIFVPRPAFEQPTAPNLFGYNPSTSTTPACGQSGCGTININIFITK